MDISKATAYAMRNVMKERSNRNAIWAIISETTENPSVELVHLFCTETGYTLAEFFSRKEFEGVE